METACGPFFVSDESTGFRLAFAFFCIHSNSDGNHVRPAHSTINVQKHGVSLDKARDLDWSEVMAMPDARNYGELVEIGYAPIGDGLFCVVFTQRGDTMHVISFRKANHREVRDHVQHS
jgi:uncharacterized DUF497 family protein